MHEDYTFENAHTFVGREMAVSDWVEIDQEQVTNFGEVTRWTPKGHVDRVWAERGGGAMAGPWCMVFSCST